MKTSLLTFSILLSFVFGNGQPKQSRLILNFGFQNSDLSKKIFNGQTTPGLVTTSQSSKIFIDINLIYQIAKDKSRFIPAFGIGFNQKGFIDKGFNILSDPMATYFTSETKNSYLSLFVGMNYKLLVSNKTNLLVGQFFIPDYNFNHSDIYKTISYSARSTVTLEHQMTSKYFLSISPFYNFAITNYNSRKVTQNSTDYRPFSFGISIGFGLK